MDKQIFLDMDGVIVDLHQPVAQKLGLTDMTVFNRGELPLPDSDIWAGTDAEWWANLPWMHDGKKIVEVCEDFVGASNVIICSKPAKWRGSAEGKLVWLEKFLPDYARRFILTPNKSWCASPRSLLIDDSESMIDEFRESAGAALLCPRPWNSLADHSYNVPAYLRFQIDEMQ